MELRRMILDKIDEYEIENLGENDIDDLDIRDAVGIIADLEHVYFNREKYKLTFAFNNAQTTINEYYKTFLTHFDIELNNYKGSDSEGHHISRFVDRLYRNLKHVRVHYTRLSSVILIISLVLSLGLVLGIHWLTEHFVYRFEAIVDAFIIVFVLGVIKLFIEERFIDERAENYGWKTYKKSVDITRNNFAKVILSYLAIKKANETGILLKDMVGQHHKMLHSLNNHND
jgi:hypothetical protein